MMIANIDTTTDGETWRQMFTDYEYGKLFNDSDLIRRVLFYEVENRRRNIFNIDSTVKKNEYFRKTDEIKLTVSSNFLFRVCISSTMRRTSPKIACSGICLIAAFLSSA